MLKRENNGGINWQPGLKGRMSLAKPTEGRRRVRERRSMCPIKAFARPPRAPWEEAPSRSPKLGKHGNKESYDKVQGSAGKGRHGICGIPGVLARRHDGGHPVEGDLRQEPGVA